MSSPLSKARRFEIFKRDRFTCQYCGRKPPEVVLHVDHVVAESVGGSSEDENLVTSCQDCNLGKSDRPLGLLRVSVGMSAEDRAERLEQMVERQKVLAQEREVVDEWVEGVVRFWAKLDGQDVEAEVWNVPHGLEASTRRFLKKLIFEEVLEAVQISFDKFPAGIGNWFQRFKYFCGVCWKKIKESGGLDVR